MTRICPKCGSLLVSRRKDTHLADKLLALFSLLPFECQTCHHRFRMSQPETDPSVLAQDRRKVFRVPAHIPVRFDCGTDTNDGILVDLSADGCSLDSKRKLQPGLLLRLHLPSGEEGRPHATTSHIATVRAVDGSRTHLKFLAFTPGEKAQLEQTITQTLTRFTIP